jgi:predicted RNA polymerase sigma factor
MAFGPQARLDLVDTLADEPALQSYHLRRACARPARQTRRGAEARAEFERAAALTRNVRERDLLLQRAAAAIPN